MSVEANAGNQEPLYNIGIVSRMTDIPENTLRAWERRYGFPESARTGGGHRLYSEIEVLRLQWVKARVGEGMQISQAVRALQHIEEEGRFPEAPLSTQTSSLYTTEDSPTLEHFRKRILDALLDHDAGVADQVLADIMAVYPLETVILNIIGPLFMEIGEAWSHNEISIATEHFATQRLRSYLLSWAQTSAPPVPVKPVVLACAPGEWHEGSLLMFGVLLRRLRWPIVYLGQSVPLPDLIQFVDSIRPSAVVLVAMTEEPAVALRDLPDSGQAPIICYGGRVFSLYPELVDETPGVYLGDTLQAGVEKLNTMLHDLHPGIA